MSINSGPEIDLDSFTRRLDAFYSNWKKWNRELWGGAEVITVVTPPSTDDLLYWKSSTLLIWLFGIEFYQTIVVFMQKRIHVLCNQKKASLFCNLKEILLKSYGIDIFVHVLSCSDASSGVISEVFESARIQCVMDPPIVGWLAKEAPEGSLSKNWNEALNKSGFSLVDVTVGFQELFVRKDFEEIQNIRKAASLSALVLKDYVIPRLQGIVKEKQKVAHSSLMDETDDVIHDPSRVNVELESEEVDICYGPIFESGGTFDLRPSAQSDDEDIYYDAGGVIICSIGSRYRHYCSNVARTFIIQPDSVQEKAYKVLLKAYEAAIASLQPGKTAAGAYEAALQIVQNEAPEFSTHLTKLAGTGIGIEFRETGLHLGLKNNRILEAGMVFNVNLGFVNIQSQRNIPKTKYFSLLLSDTIIIKDSGPENATHVVLKSIDVLHLSYFDVKDQEITGIEYSQTSNDHVQKTIKEFHQLGSSERDEIGQGTSDSLQTQQPDMSEKKMKHAVLGTDNEEEKENVGYSKCKDQNPVVKFIKREIREDNVPEIQHANIVEGTRAKQCYTGVTSDSVVSDDVLPYIKVNEDLAAYQNVEDIPFSRDLMIQIDHKNQTVLFPINGDMVPFHISTIQNVSTQHVSAGSFIHIVFNTPASGYEVNDNFSPNLQGSVYLKEIFYRSKDTRHSNQVEQLVKGLRDQFLAKHLEETKIPVCLLDGKLQILKSKYFRLLSIWMRPSVEGKKKKVIGALEGNMNGFSFLAVHDLKVGIIYKDIKYAFVQPANKETNSFIHFHLHKYIKIGDLKTKDVQFGCLNLESVSSDEKADKFSRSKNYADFNKFVQKLSEIWQQPQFRDLHLEFDMPKQEYAFHGIAHRTCGFIVPTERCLVELMQMPSLVITLREIEIVCLERVGIGQSTFDMAVIFKGFNQDVVHIDAIPDDELKNIKTWLDSMNIKYYEIPRSIDSQAILDIIKVDPEQFMEDGGWEFLNLEYSDSDLDNSDESNQHSEMEESAMNVDYLYHASTIESDKNSEDGDKRITDEQKQEPENGKGEICMESFCSEENPCSKANSETRPELADFRDLREMSPKRIKLT